MGLTKRSILEYLKKYRHADEKLDRLIGIRYLQPEGKLNLGEMFVHYGIHRLEYGDHPYSFIFQIFQQPEVNRIQSLHDFGCGYGRIVLLAGLQGIEASGIEIVTERILAAQAAQRYLGLKNITLHCGDATQMPPPECSHYCILNSFFHPSLRGIVGKLRLIAKRRDITIISSSLTNLFLESRIWLEDASPKGGDSLGLRFFRSRCT